MTEELMPRHKLEARLRAYEMLITALLACLTDKQFYGINMINLGGDAPPALSQEIKQNISFILEEARDIRKP